MAFIHHPELERDAEVPDETVEIWIESGWRPGTCECPEPWNPPSLDGEEIPAEEPAPDLVTPDESTVPVGDTATPSRKR